MNATLSTPSIIANLYRERIECVEARSPLSFIVQFESKGRRAVYMVQGQFTNMVTPLHLELFINDVFKKRGCQKMTVLINRTKQINGKMTIWGGIAYSQFTDNVIYEQTLYWGNEENVAI